jgi:ABC-type lipoprotein export system ATPase subunit
MPAGSHAFLADPALLIPDEPTAHLDPATRRAFTADLLHATEGRSVVLITRQRDGLDQVDQIGHRRLGSPTAEPVLSLHSGDVTRPSPCAMVHGSEQRTR